MAYPAEQRQAGSGCRGQWAWWKASPEQIQASVPRAQMLEGAVAAASLKGWSLRKSCVQGDGEVSSVEAPPPEQGMWLPPAGSHGQGQRAQRPPSIPREPWVYVAHGCP